MTIRDVIAVLKEDMIVTIERVDRSAIVSDTGTLKETYNKDFMDTEVVSFDIEKVERDEGVELRPFLETKLPPLQCLFVYKIDKHRAKRVYSKKNN